MELKWQVSTSYQGSKYYGFGATAGDAEDDLRIKLAKIVRKLDEVQRAKEEFLSQARAFIGSGFPLQK